jgi:hypothetical protein
MKIKLFKFKVSRLVSPLMPRVEQQKTVAAKSYIHALKALNLQFMDKVILVEEKSFNK